MLLSLPPETIEKVVTFVTAQEVVGGPPPGLYALMQTCRYLHYLLSPEHNPGMFYRLFRNLFDLAAPQRRTSCSSTGPAQFAAETCQRFASLRLIRAGSFDHPEMCKSLLVTYVMVLEDDGKNGMHLQWAGLRNFLQVYLTEHYPDNDTNDSLWSLAIILQTQWLFIDTLRSESEDERDGMLSMLDPHLLGQLYFKPTTCCESNDIASSNSCSGFPSRCLHALPHYGHCYDVDIPAIAPYAILSYILRIERYQLVNPQNVPATRSARIGFGPTKEDFDHYNAACLAHASPDHFSPQATSSQNDSDWARLISRHATLLPGTRVRSFRVGDLSGFWDGTLLLPSLHPVNKNAGHQRGLGPVEYLSRRPIALELREHYSNATPLSPVVCCEQAFDKSSIQSVLCECALNLRGRCHEVDACLHSDKVHCVSPACTCNCFSKRVELNDSAVTEVFLSGTTPAEHGVAWGSYRFRGRVRMSDGLVILRRDPIGFGAASPAWLFGYVLGSRQLVGRWHVGSLQNEAPWEGVFGLWKSVT